MIEMKQTMNIEEDGKQDEENEKSTEMEINVSDTKTKKKSEAEDGGKITEDKAKIKKEIKGFITIRPDPMTYLPDPNPIH